MTTRWYPEWNDRPEASRAERLAAREAYRRAHPEPPVGRGWVWSNAALGYEVLYAVITDGVGNLLLVAGSETTDVDLLGHRWPAPSPDDRAEDAHETHQQIGQALVELLDDDWDAGG